MEVESLQPKGCKLWYSRYGNRDSVASSEKASTHCENVKARIQKNLETANFTCTAGAISQDNSTPVAKPQPAPKAQPAAAQAAAPAAAKAADKVKAPMVPAAVAAPAPAAPAKTAAAPASPAPAAAPAKFDSQKK